MPDVCTEEPNRSTDPQQTDAYPNGWSVAMTPEQRQQLEAEERARQQQPVADCTQFQQGEWAEYQAAKSQMKRESLMRMAFKAMIPFPVPGGGVVRFLAKKLGFGALDKRFGSGDVPENADELANDAIAKNGCPANGGEMSLSKDAQIDEYKRLAALAAQHPEDAGLQATLQARGNHLTKNVGVTPDELAPPSQNFTPAAPPDEQSSSE